MPKKPLKYGYSKQTSKKKHRSRLLSVFNILQNVFCLQHVLKSIKTLHIKHRKCNSLPPRLHAPGRE